MKRVATVVGGFGLLLAGAALMVLPGPGIPLVVAGLGLLSLEYDWARRLRQRILARAPQKRSHRIALAVGGALAVVVGAVVGLLWLY